MFGAAPANPDERLDQQNMDQANTEQSGEHASELTHNGALVERIDNLNLDTDTETLMPSLRRRASVGSQTESANGAIERVRRNWAERQKSAVYSKLVSPRAYLGTNRADFS